MVSFLFVLGIIGALFLAAVQGGWNPFVNIGSDAIQSGGSAIYNMIKGGGKSRNRKKC
jgi:hypothetical protein